MEHQKQITPFISFGNVALFFSLAIIIAGVVSVYLLGGLNLGIDFKSGVSLQVQFMQSDPPSTEEVRAALDDFGTVSVQQITDGRGRYVIKSDLGDEGNDAIVNMLQERLRSEFGADQLEVLEVAFIGPRYSGSIARQSIILTLSALALILLYIWIRFRFYYAMSAVIALVHDVLMTVIFLGISRVELSTTTVAAILTIIGYSLNDTVVIFDRIRENNEIYQRDVPFAKVANISIRQSLSRTLITSVTTLLAVVAIYIFSTGSIQDFALCMIFGVIVGTYSSICIASPVLVSWTKHSARAHRSTTKIQKQASGGGAAIAADTTAQTEALPIADRREKKKEAISVNTDRIRQELITRRKQQQKKKKK